ncbi:ethylene-responsive transcription factor-like protein isoform X1 [Tanacetum coccineum]|uniref:Ethylene-responsive transcription factor-like protein isoform X1 n=1 Tax=Tanacetum coccineum TaxID=301880 RepID=A0ABQ5JF56_9ASTR
MITAATADNLPAVLVGSWGTNKGTHFGLVGLLFIRGSDDTEITKSEEGDSSIVTESNTSNKLSVLLPEFKRRKRHRRKNIENQEQCIMRGVYYKNMKWQAAIKVDKKQIHLGTVGSQEEAARLYDRAAYLCGREPNFDLTIEEKEELSKLSWDDFLIMTRSAINSKKSQRRVTSRMKFENFQPNNSGSEMEAVAEAEAEADQGINGFSGIVGGGIGTLSKHRKVHGLANMSATYATNLAIVTGCYCGAREIVRLSRHSEPDDLFDSAIAGFGTGALLGRLQDSASHYVGGVPGAVRYSIGIAIVGTGIDYAAIKLRPVFRNMYESVAASDEKKNSWFKWPEWLPIQVLDEEAQAAKRAREENLRARIRDLTKED